MNLMIDALQQGMIYAILAYGIYISFRILSIPDLTTEGSFVFGLAVSAMCTSAGHPFLAMILAMIAGAAAGCVTGFMQTKLKIHPILAGIITMSGLYSINLLVQGNAVNVTLLRVDTLFKLMPLSKSASKTVLTMVFGIGACAILIVFFKTHLGMCIRAVGDNEAMVRASSINADRCKISALAIANAFIALSGAVLAQFQGYSDISSGTGTLVIGLASVIIGEAFFGQRSVTIGFISTMVGSVIYRLILAYAMKYSPLDVFMLKLVSALIVALALAIPAARGWITEANLRRKGDKHHA